VTGVNFTRNGAGAVLELCLADDRPTTRIQELMAACQAVIGNLDVDARPGDCSVGGHAAEMTRRRRGAAVIVLRPRAQAVDVRLRVGRHDVGWVVLDVPGSRSIPRRARLSSRVLFSTMSLLTLAIEGRELRRSARLPACLDKVAAKAPYARTGQTFEVRSGELTLSVTVAQSDRWSVVEAMRVVS
jgi:hypothetical protein